MSKITETLRRIVEQARKGHTYKVERAKIIFTDEVGERMETLGLSRKDLAECLGTKPPYVTKILRGSTNFTLDSMVKIADALDCDFSPNMTPREVDGRWITFFVRDEKTSLRPAAKVDDDTMNNGWLPSQPPPEEDTNERPVAA